ncbi:four-carbon acid sugar kinase family protein [Streptomyces sp. NPDC059479]|uniref:four-carbon acid sugar kinase family protein n=1 Tax=Streptomyces sp. NPDC059479 TaxID=3346848 RepID=UPI0036AD3CD9
MFLTPRNGRAPCPVLALADDLSGAAETAAALRLPARIVLGPGATPPADAGRVLIVDLDTRQRDAGEAARIVREAVRTAAAGTVLIKKTDSLLRGNLAAETAAYAEGADGLVFAPALPVAGRTVRDGIVHLHGRPLHETDAWRAETRPVPRSVAEALGGIPTAVVPLAAVRSSLGDLTARLRDFIAAGLTPVCDSEADADLDALAAAALRLGPGARLMGTGGFAAALGRVLAGADGPPKPSGEFLESPEPSEPSELPSEVAHGPSSGPRPVPARASEVARPLLVVVGTAEPGAVAQIAQLTAVGARHLALPMELLTRTGAPVPLTVGPEDALTVVSVDNSEGIQAGSARRVVAGLARSVATVPYPADLVLTGGETARRVLDALGVSQLLPVGQIHHGAVHSRTPDGRSVVTRPGSYGDTGSLLRIARALRPHHPFASAVPSGPPVAPVPVPASASASASVPVPSVPQGEVL